MIVGAELVKVKECEEREMREYTLKSFGAVGNGQQNESEAFAKALAALSDGGVLHIEEGTYLTGPLHIQAKGLVLELDRGAVIQFIADEK